MDTELARTLLAVVAAGSFVKASERLFVTQSTVSARIQALEELLRCRLFERNKDGTTLTPAGRQFQKHAAALMRTLERARQDVGVPDGYRGSLTIGGRIGIWENFLLGTLALVEIARGELAIASVLMLIALFVDSIDGTLARRARVSEVVPRIDGRRLDDVVDYLNYVIVPVFFMLWIGALPLLFKLLSGAISSYGFLNHPSFTLAAVMAGVTVLLSLVYGVVQLFLHGLKGVTVGKAIAGIRTVNVRTLERPGVGAVLLRFLIVGASESLLRFDAGFACEERAGSFLYRKGGS